MEKSKKYLLIVSALIVVAIAGYYIVGGSFNMSPSDAAGSGIDGIEPAKKHKGEAKLPLI